MIFPSKSYKLLQQQIPVFKLKSIPFTYFLKKDRVVTPDIRELRWAKFNLNQRIKFKEWRKSLYTRLNYFAKLKNAYRQFVGLQDVYFTKRLTDKVVVELHIGPETGPSTLNTYYWLKYRFRYFENKWHYKLLIYIIIFNSYR